MNDNELGAPDWVYPFAVLCIWLFGLAPIYLAIAFIHWQLNPVDWTTFGRCVAVIAAGIWTFGVSDAALTDEDPLV